MKTVYIFLSATVLGCISHTQESSPKQDSLNNNTVLTADTLKSSHREVKEVLTGASFVLRDSRQYRFQDIDIILNQYTDSSSRKLPPSWSIITRSGTDTIDQKVYKHIDALGGYAGLLVPDPQPAEGYFILVKYGDYDGNLLLIDEFGEIRTIKGGSFFKTSDQRYLVSIYSSDCAGLTVFDLKEDSLIYDKNCGNDNSFGESSFYTQWYIDKNGNYYWLGNYGDTDAEGFYWLYQFSFAEKTLTLEKVKKDFLDQLEEVKWALVPGDH